MTTGLVAPPAPAGSSQPPPQTPHAGLASQAPAPIRTGLVFPSAPADISNATAQWTDLWANAYTQTWGLGGSSLFGTYA